MGLRAFERFSLSQREELRLDPLPETVSLMESLRNATAPSQPAQAERRNSTPAALAEEPEPAAGERAKTA